MTLPGVIRFCTMKYIKAPLALTGPVFVLHFTLVAVPLVFGSILALYDDVFETAPVYREMARYGNEARWATWTLILAAIYAAAWYSMKRPFLLAAHMMLTFWHGMVGLCMFIGNNHSVNSPTYMVLAVSAALRLVGMARGRSY